jgi:outer membrane lipoprotein-sorting protein
MRGPTPVTYCQDNSINCPTVDNNGTYTYLTTNSSDFTGYRLLRIQTSQLQDLANFPTNVQYWQGTAGADITNSVNWTSTVGNAVPIITGHHLGQSQIYYIAALQRYIFVAWEFQEYSTSLTPGGNYSQRVIYSATSLAGPWTASSIVPGDDQYLAYFALFPSTVSQISTSPNLVTATLASVGDYTTQNGGGANALNTYSLHYEPMLLSLSNAPVATPKFVGHGRNDLVMSGLVQDLQFFPEQSSSATITDYSGNGNTANGAFQGIYTGQGNASFDGQAYYVNTNNKYSGRDFTIFQVFRKQWSMSGYEQIISNGSTSTCPINIFRYSTGTSSPVADTWEAAICVAVGSATQFTLADGPWQMLAIVRSGTTVSIYDANSFTQTSATPLVTATIPSTNINSPQPISLGNQLDQLSKTNQWFEGQHNRFVFYNRALSTQELIQDALSIESDAKKRGVVLGRPIFPGERELDSQLAAPVYSTRRILSGYTGPLLRVHRASDSAEMDISTAVGTDNLDTVTLQSFCGTSTLTVPVWYDQSYQHYDAVQTTISNQPIICNAGTLETSGTNRKAALYFDGSRYMTQTNFFYYGISGSECAVASIASGSAAYAAVSGWFNPATTSYNSLTSASAIIRNASIQGLYATVNNASSWTTGSSPNVAYGASSSVCMAAGSKDLRMWVDETASTPLGYKTSEAAYNRQRLQFNNVGVGLDGVGNSQYLTGTISELFFMPYGIDSAEQGAVQADQKAYFGTP